MILSLFLNKKKFDFVTVSTVHFKLSTIINSMSKHCFDWNSFHIEISVSFWSESRRFYSYDMIKRIIRMRESVDSYPYYSFTKLLVLMFQRFFFVCFFWSNMSHLKCIHMYNFCFLLFHLLPNKSRTCIKLSFAPMSICLRTISLCVCIFII